MHLRWHYLEVFTFLVMTSAYFMYSSEEYEKLAKLDEWLAICVKTTCRLQRLEDVIGKLENFYGFCIKLIWRECIDELERCYWKIWKVLWLLHQMDSAFCIWSYYNFFSYSIYLLFAAESFAGRFSHLLTVTIKAFLSKLYFIVQCKVPKTWLGSIRDVEAEDDALRLNAAKSESISPFSSSITPDKSPYISEPAPAN